MSKIRILSIDGGGIRGVLPGVILEYIEDRLRSLKGDEVRLSDYFDMMAGTSTGGILTCLYLTPDENNRPKYTAREAVELYLKNGTEIFNVPFSRNLKTLWGIRRPKHSPVVIKKKLGTYFEELTLDQLLKPCVITSYDIEKRAAYFFARSDAASDLRNFKVKDIARSTSAAPTYFPPSHIRSLYGTEYSLVDGGVFANNPAMCAYAEARTHEFNIDGKKDKPYAQNMFIFSIGTGTVKEKYPHSKAKKYGYAKWALPVIDIMMSGNSETVDYQLKQIFGTLEGDHKNDYIRIMPELYNANSNMADASTENLKELEKAGKTFVSENVETLNGIVDKLIEYS